MIQLFKKLFKRIKPLIKSKYSIEYLAIQGAMTVYTDYYKCYAYSKRDAFNKFLKETKGNHFYTCRENLNNFQYMKPFIKNLGSVKKITAKIQSEKAKAFEQTRFYRGY